MAIHEPRRPFRGGRESTNVYIRIPAWVRGGNSMQSMQTALFPFLFHNLKLNNENGTKIIIIQSFLTFDLKPK